MTYQVQVSQETQHLYCRECRREWPETLQVSRYTDHSGDKYVVYRRDGVACTTPTAHPCPRCGHSPLALVPAHGW